MESTDKMGNIGDQLTLEKNIPLSGLEPGIYSITIKVKDNISQQTISPMAKFAVEADPTPVQRAAAPGK